jgi:hypothetical protein
MKTTIATLLMLALSTSALAADNDPDPAPTLDPATCKGLLDAYSDLLIQLARLSTCGLPQCVIAATDIRILLSEISDAWIEGGCYIYGSSLPTLTRQGVPTYSGKAR